MLVIRDREWRGVETAPRPEGEVDVELPSLLIAAGFVFYAWVFLLRSRRGHVARGRPLTLTAEGAHVPARLGHPRLKFFLEAVLALVILLLVLVTLVIGSGLFVRPSCTTGVVTTEGPHGETIECVCVGGVQALCFEPKP
jgi:hypothetical protein